MEEITQKELIQERHQFIRYINQQVQTLVSWNARDPENLLAGDLRDQQGDYEDIQFLKNVSQI